MSTTTTQWILELVDKISSPMKGVTGSSNEAAVGVDKVGKNADEAGKKLKEMSAIDLYAVSQSVNQLADDFEKALSPGIAFDSQLKELQAITGVAGASLEQMGENARESAMMFGGDASDMLESYKGILSRLGPDIAKNQNALDDMGDNVLTLSKTMGNDAVGAMDALTTSMLQFGVDLSNPQEAADQMTLMMNVMAAAAKEGASEVNQSSQAIKVAGVEASKQKLSFEEMNAAVQALAQGGKYGAEAGTALRNVLGKMSGIDIIPKEAAEKLIALGVNYDIVSNKALPFTTRLRELQKAQGDATIMAQIFGTENAAAAEILLRSADYQDEMVTKITGTNVAFEQAGIVMSSYEEKVRRTKAWLSDLGISLFDVAGGMLPFVSGTAGAVTMLANLANAKQGVGLLFDFLKTTPIIGSIVSGGFGIMSTAIKVFSATVLGIPGFGWIAAAITAVTAGVVYFSGALDDTAESQSDFNEQLTKSKTALNDEFSALRKTKEGTNERKKAIDEINSKYGEYLDNLLTEKSSLEDIAIAQQQATTALENNIAIKIGKEKKDAIVSKTTTELNDVFNSVVGLVEDKHGKSSQVAGESARDVNKILDNIRGGKMDALMVESFARKYGIDMTEALREFVVANISVRNQNASLNRIDSFTSGYTKGGTATIKQGGNTSPTLTPMDLGQGLSGNGSSQGSIKNISQKIDMKNYFTMTGAGDVDAIVEKVVRVLNDRLRDGVIAAG